MTTSRDALGWRSDRNLQEQDGPAPAAGPQGGEVTPLLQSANSSAASQTSEPQTSELLTVNLGGRGATSLAHEEEAGRSCRLPRETGQDVGGSSKTATGSPAPTWPRPAVSWKAGLVLRHVTRALAPPVYSHSLSPVPKLERAT